VSNRIVTQQDKVAAKRLKKIYLRKKGELGLTQTKLGKSMKLSQSSVANYMRGEFSMNLDTVLRFSKVLEVDPHEIDPKLNKRFSVVPLAGATEIAVIGTLSGAYSTTRTAKVRGLNYMNHQLAILIDNHALTPILPQGSTLIVDPKAAITSGSRIAVQYKEDGGHVPYELVEMSEDSITVRAFSEVSKDRRDLMEKKYFPHKPMMIPLADIANIVKVVGLQYP